MKIKNLTDIPKVSVILSCHNSKIEFIEELLQGLFVQTYTNWELILCDHDSNVSTKNWIPNDKRIKHLGEYNKDDQWQYLINNSQGEIIIHHHDDDISLPHRIEAQVKYLKDNPELDACSGGIITFGATNGIKVCWVMKNEELQRQLVFRQHIMAPTLSTRRNVKIDISQTNEIAKIAKDFEWFSRRIDLKQDIIPEILVNFRKHKNSDTSLNTTQIATDHANIVCRNLKVRFGIEAPFELGQLLNPHIKAVEMSKNMYEYCLNIFELNKSKIVDYCGEKLYYNKIEQIKNKIIVSKGNLWI
jgi:glycosyltransferase involved in cell wall biosynthesis